MNLSEATRLVTGRLSAVTLVLLLVFMAPPSVSKAQTRNQLQNNNAPGYNYQSGAYRKLFYVPLDTLATADSGAIAFKGGLLWVKQDPYWALSSGVNFAIADLVLNGNRNHWFGPNSMRFNFEGLGLNGNTYVGFNDGYIPGITIAGDNTYFPPAIMMKDLATPGNPMQILGNGGEMLIDGSSGSGYGYGRFGPFGTAIGTETNNIDKRILLWNGTEGRFGITIRDSMDNAGMHYEHNYKDSGLAKFGDRWIPDAGWIKSRLPDDFFYMTEDDGCHDTSFVNEAGVSIASYELVTLPQFIGHRIRVNWGGLALAEDARWGWSWYYRWDKNLGILRIYQSGPCTVPSGGGQILIQAY